MGARKMLGLAAVAGSAMIMSAAATAQPMPSNSTRLDVVGTGEAERTPDLAIISAGVQTLQPTASAAIEQNAAKMEKVRAALKKAGIADKDIQTASISLHPEYRYAEGKAPALTGYRATNTVSVKFRDLKRAGSILDALVKEGANDLNGPSLTIEDPTSAMDEARVKAIADGRRRADVYATALGKRVVRIISVSEQGANVPPPMPYAADAMVQSAGRMAKTSIEPGTQSIQTSVSMSFEIQ